MPALNHARLRTISNLSYDTDTRAPSILYQCILLHHLLDVRCYLEWRACLLANLILGHAWRQFNQRQSALLPVDLENTEICRETEDLSVSPQRPRRTVSLTCDDRVHTAFSSQRQVALWQDLVCISFGYVVHHDHDLRLVWIRYQVDSSSWTFDQLPRNHIIRKISICRDLHGSKHAYVDVSTSDHGEGFTFFLCLFWIVSFCGLFIWTFLSSAKQRVCTSYFGANYNGKRRACIAMNRQLTGLICCERTC